MATEEDVSLLRKYERPIMKSVEFLSFLYLIVSVHLYWIVCKFRMILIDAT